MKNRNRSGMLLVTILIIMGALMAFATAIFVYTNSRSKAGEVEMEADQALTLADGGTEIAAKSVLSALADYGTVPTTATVEVNGSDITYTIAPIGAPRSTTSSAGLYTLYQQYEISSSTTNGDVPQTVKTIIDAGKTPIFQFLSFYNDDLEMLPGANMTLNGRIHTNKDLYIGTNSTLTLNTKSVRAAGEMYRHRKDDGTTFSGTTKVQALTSGALVNWANGLESTSPTWTAQAAANWQGSVQSQEQGVTALEAPTVPSVEQGGYLNNNAGLVILDGQAYVGGANVTSSLPAGTLSSATIYDAREGKTITTTKVDISKLNASGKFPPNGLLWAGRTDTTSSQPNAIQLINGSTLNAALTVVSPDPVYIKGDYNTVSKKSAAVIADALNLLSNGWNNSKTASSSLPVATNTTYNAAFIAGNVPTSGSSYSGGFENYPRFHENWSGKTCTIRGAFAELWESQYAKAKWPGTGGHFYNPPTRNWDYDSAFDTAANLPPFTPWTARVGRVAWWEP